nr:MAG TPA_asm: hypothetical protein [Caudoviricetes sp.]
MTAGIRTASVPLLPLSGRREPTVADLRRGRIRALIALMDVLAREGVESTGDHAYSVLKDPAGGWRMTVTTEVHPETWRTARVHGRFGPCDRCHRRGHGVPRCGASPTGYRCTDTAACAAAAVNARTCELCGHLGTRYTHFTTPAGLTLCKDGAACEARETAIAAHTKRQETMPATI